MRTSTAELQRWGLLWAVFSIFVVCVIAATIAGRRRGSSFGEAVAAGLERLTLVPAWAAALALMTTTGLIVGGNGFYSDFVWHLAHGRDEELWTAPHVGILTGSAFVCAACLVAVAYARRSEIGVRRLGVRWPRSAVLAGAFGASAIGGFALDTVWHDLYGVDVKITSPTHMLILCGTALSVLAGWLALGESGVRAAHRRATVYHLAFGVIALYSFTGLQAEFALGLPQFQQLYHPILYAAAAGVVLPASVLATGKWWAPLLPAGAGALVFAGDLAGASAGASVRAASNYLVAALGTAAVALVIGSERRLRFALWSGSVIGTAGLAWEWLWSRGGTQPWGSALLPEAPIVAGGVALAAALLGVAFGASVRGEHVGLPGRILVVAGVVLVLGLAFPLPRRGSTVTGAIDVERSGDRVAVRVRLDPPHAADDARWFQLISWQGGGLETARMLPASERGVFESEGAVSIGGEWKTVLRLHRGAEMVAVPIWLPADPDIGRPEVPIRDRVAPFRPEHRYLLREQHDGPIWFAVVLYVLLSIIAGVWIALIVWATRHVGWSAPEGGGPTNTRAILAS